MTFPVTPDQLNRFLIGKVFYTLLAAPMIFDPETLVGCVDQAECMTAETMHVTVCSWDTPVAHHNRDLVQRFRQQSPKIPVIICTPQVGLRIPLHRFV